MRRHFKPLIQAFFLFFFTFISSAAEITWQQCVDMALEKNPSILAARASLDRARANSWTTFGNALPQVSVSGSYGKSGDEPLGGPFIYGDSYSVNLSARQLIFDGMKTFQNMLKAGEDVKAAEISYKINSASVREKLAQAYSGLMKAQELVKISEEILSLRKKQLADIRLRYQAGREHKGSLLSVEADLMQAEAEKRQADEALALAQAGLADMLGMESGGLSVRTDFSSFVDTSKAPDFDKLLADNPSFLVLAAQKNSAANSAGAAISAFFPSVSLSASAGRSDASLPLEDTRWSFGINASLQLFDSGILLAQSSAAQASLRQAEAALDEGGRAVILGLKQAWNDLKNSAENLAVQEKYLQAANERARISDAQYKNGLLNFDNWTIIQNSLVSSRKSYLNAQAGLLVKEAAWIKAKGGTLEEEKQ